MNKESKVKICYEAGPCGYALHRILNKKGFACEIVAPSLIPVKNGNRVKTDKKDAIKLATLYEANQLTFIAVPDEHKESVRDLVRCREDLKGDIKRVKQRLNHLLIRRGFHYAGKNWTKGYMEWLQQIRLKDHCAQVTLNQYINQKQLLETQLADIDQEIEEIAQSPEYRDKVAALCAFRGIAVLTAMIIISEVVDFSRFTRAEELMAYLGMVPSEHSSGGNINKGSITKTGNKRVRRALVEASWHYRHAPVITQGMKRNLTIIEPELRIPPKNCLKRLNKKYYHLTYRGKLPQKAIVGVARELSGFIWDSMVQVEKKEREKLVA